MAAITAVSTDPVQMASMLQHLGMDMGESVSMISQTIKHQYDTSANKDAMRIRFQSVGAAVDIINNAQAVRLGGSISEGGRVGWNRKDPSRAF